MVSQVVVDFSNLTVDFMDLKVLTLSLIMNLQIIDSDDLISLFHICITGVRVEDSTLTVNVDEIVLPYIQS